MGGGIWAGAADCAGDGKFQQNMNSGDESENYYIERFFAYYSAMTEERVTG